MIRESEDLLKCVVIYLLSTFGGVGVFALKEIGCGSLLRLPQLLFCRGEFFALFSPFNHHRRIEKHRAQRQGLGFDTLECPYQIGNAPISPDGVVLSEDVSNLLANAMFEKGRSSDSVFRDICALAERCWILVVVTIAGLKDDGYGEETAAYINGLNEINRKLFEKASIAISIHCALYWK